MLLTACGDSGADEQGVEAFFSRYVALGQSYDVAVTELYADSAVIASSERRDAALVPLMEVPGTAWKSLIASAMPFAEEAGDRSTFSNIEISADGTRARIKADRYSELLCYTDTGYYMVVEQQPDGEYMIVEEYFEAPPESQC